MALQRFFFLGRFLASGMSMGWLEGMSGGGGQGGFSPIKHGPPLPPQPPHCCGLMLTGTGWAVEVKFRLQAGGLLERQLKGVLALGGGGLGVTVRGTRMGGNPHPTARGYGCCCPIGTEQPRAMGRGGSAHMGWGLLGSCPAMGGHRASRPPPPQP